MKTNHWVYFTDSDSLYHDENHGKRERGIMNVTLLIIQMGTSKQATVLNTVFRHISLELYVSSTCAHHQEVKTALYSLWYHHTYRCDDTRGTCARNM
jgi:hypothetical protein